MPRQNAAKSAIRAYAKAQNVNYTTALRELEGDDALRAEHAFERPTTSSARLFAATGHMYQLIRQAPSRFTAGAELAAARHFAALIALDAIGGDIEDDRDLRMVNWDEDTVALTHVVTIPASISGGSPTVVTVETTGAARSRTLKLHASIGQSDDTPSAVDGALKAATTSESIANAAQRLTAALPSASGLYAFEYREYLWMKAHSLELGSEAVCLCDFSDISHIHYEHTGLPRLTCRLPHFDHQRTFSTRVPGKRGLVPAAISWAPYLSVNPTDSRGYQERLTGVAAAQNLSVRFGNPKDDLYGYGSTPIIMWNADILDLTV